MKQSKIVNPNFAVIKTFDIIYLITSLFAFLGMAGTGFNWIFMSIGILGSGLFLARWILVWSGFRVKHQAEAIVTGNAQIASWVLSNDALKEYATAETIRQKFEAQTAFIAFIFAGCLASLIGIIPVPLWAGALLGIGLGAFGMLISYFHNKIYYNHLINSLGDIYIGLTGVVISGVYQEWDSLGRNLEKLEYNENLRSLIFTISVRSKNGTTTRNIHVPVPDDKTKSIEEILRAFASQYQEDQK